MSEAQGATALEAEFAAALLSPELPPPAGVKVPPGANAAHRFGVYRNNVVAGLVTALGERFPVTKRLVGEEFFDAVARAYVAEQPPRSPLLFRYGESFPQFVAAIEAAAAVPYLRDVARLEFLRGEAYHAADRAPLPPSELARLSELDIVSAGLALHPSLRVLSSRHPVVGIWQAHQREAEPVVKEWNAEDALVIRSVFAVDVHVLPPGALAFVSAVARGAAIGDAVSVAREDNADFDPQAAFTLLIATQAIVGLRTR